MMSKKQLSALFVCGLVTWTIIQGTMALLPVYAVRLGAEPASIGMYLALAFLALTLGTLVTGWLADKFQRRKAMVVLAGAVNAPVTWLMGQTTAFWQLATYRDAYGLYAGHAWQKRLVDGAEYSVELGGGGFLFYRTLRFNGPHVLVPAVLPVLSVEHKATHFGVNVVVVPQCRVSGGTMPGVIYMQFTKAF